MGRLGYPAKMLSLLVCAILSQAEVSDRMFVLELRAGEELSESSMRLLNDLVLSEFQKKTRDLEVTGESDLQTMLSIEQRKQLLGCEDTGCLIEIGGALGAKFIASGSVGQLGDSFLLNLKLVNAREARVVATWSEQIAQDKIVDGVRAAVADILPTMSIVVTYAVDMDPDSVRVLGTLPGNEPVWNSARILQLDPGPAGWPVGTQGIEIRAQSLTNQRSEVARIFDVLPNAITSITPPSGSILMADDSSITIEFETATSAADFSLDGGSLVTQATVVVNGSTVTVTPTVAWQDSAGQEETLLISSTATGALTLQYFIDLFPPAIVIPNRTTRISTADTIQVNANEPLQDVQILGGSSFGTEASVVINSAEPHRLSIAPSPDWAVGIGQTLDLVVTDLAERSTQTTLTFDITAPGEVIYFVTDNAGTSTNGTSDEPMTLGNALFLANAGSEAAELRLAAGNYNESSSLTVTGNISIKGGYNGTDWFLVPLPRTTPSILTVDDTELSALSINGGVTVTVEGMTIVAPANDMAPLVASISIDASATSVAIDECDLISGGAAAYRGVDTAVLTALSISHSRIWGSGEDSLTGIELGSMSFAFIDTNLLELSGSGNAGAMTRGIRSSGIIPNVQIWNNTMRVGRPTDGNAVGIELGPNAPGEVSNNILIVQGTTTACVDSAQTIIDLRNNALLSCGFLYNTETMLSGLIDTVQSGTGVSLGNSLMNVRPAGIDVVQMFVTGGGNDLSMNDWHLLCANAASLCTAGFQPAGSSATDFSGASRSAPFAIGAYDSE